ncbi:protein takeout-like [Schistocerca nitens]|uniref:protein takeout-like n=1 Tax=Schistocerca nitens TaxID=7011 RepID=UPI0021184722|nr:protein takeout-like [Schistocerca nitens]
MVMIWHKGYVGMRKGRPAANAQVAAGGPEPPPPRPAEASSAPPPPDMLPTAASAVAAASLLLLAADAAHLPAEFAVCKRNAPDMGKCLKAALQDVIKHLPPGIPSLGVVPLDPLDVPEIDIRDGTKNLNLRITFRNVRVTGLINADIKSVTADLDTNKMTLLGEEPHILFEADYTMTGKFLVVPVEGAGKCKFVFDNMESRLELESERVQKQGHDYWDPQRFPVEILGLGSMKIEFENLFNGDPNLGPNFNRLLNENWSEFWAALRPTFQESFGVLFLDFARKVFQKVPLDEIFPQ